MSATEHVLLNLFGRREKPCDLSCAFPLVLRGLGLRPLPMARKKTLEQFLTIFPRHSCWRRYSPHLLVMILKVSAFFHRLREGTRPHDTCHHHPGAKQPPMYCSLYSYVLSSLSQPVLASVYCTLLHHCCCSAYAVQYAAAAVCKVCAVLSSVALLYALPAQLVPCSMGAMHDETLFPTNLICPKTIVFSRRNGRVKNFF